LLIQLAERFSDPVRKDLDGLGRFVLTPEAQELARLANAETPKLRTHDRQGRRVDLVEYHPAYHALMRRSVANGLHSSVWENGDAEIGRRHQVRAARTWWRRPISASPFSQTEECSPLATERRIKAW
jgi:putative acyl-CoA dehydrogenase